MDGAFAAEAPARLRYGSLPRRLAIAAALVAVAVTAALAIGPVTIAPGEVIAILFGDATDPRSAAVIWQLRLPRVVLAGLVGAGLAVAGAMMQGLFRNPMADPGLIGVSAGAALVAAGTLVFGERLLPIGWTAYVLPLGAFFGGLVATWIVYRCSNVEGRTSIAVLLLAGIAVNALAMAGTGLLVFLSDDRQVRDINFWMLGSVGGATWTKIMAIAPFVLLPLLLMPWLSRALDALNLGEREAGHLGFPVETVKRVCCLAVALAVGGAVSVSGIIAFIGLVVPHLVRLAVGPRQSQLLPLSALCGAALLIAADIGARSLMAPADLPIGLLTSLIGGPFFLAMILRARKEFSA